MDILQEWVRELGLRHQGVLLTAVRGCDTVPRDDPSKWLSRFYRGCILRPHCGDITQSASFMLWTDNAGEFWDCASNFLQSHDHYPHHFLMHLVHAAEILGYKMPLVVQRTWWLRFYTLMVKKLHMNPETEAQLDARLNADERTFAEQQRTNP